MAGGGSHRLGPVLLLAALLHSAGGLPAQENPSPAADRFGFQELMEGDYATGSWAGLRDPLERRGLDFFANYTAEVWGNVAGGQRRGWVYTGLLDFGATLDLEKLVGWHGATLQNSWLWLSGQGPSSALVGDGLFAVSSIEGVATFRMFELWLQQSLFEEILSLRAGQLSADQEFAISEYAQLFCNSAFGWPPFLSASLPNGGPAYPLPAPGLRLELKPANWLTIRSAVFQGNPGTEEENRHGFEYDFSGDNGALFLNELVLRWEGIAAYHLPGNFKAGAWFHTANFPDSAGVGTTFPGNNGFYFILDQRLWQHAMEVAQSDAAASVDESPILLPGQVATGIGAFFRLGFQPPDRNELSFYFDGGVTWQGLIPGREDDTAGVSLACGQLSQGAIQGLLSENQPAPGVELAIEATYQVQLNEWFVIQPTLQTVIQPGGSSQLANALLLGLRTTVVF